MILRPPRSTRSDTHFPYTTRFRSPSRAATFDPVAPGKSRSFPIIVPISRSICPPRWAGPGLRTRSEEHTSELQSLMRISYAVFCLKKKNTRDKILQDISHTLERHPLSTPTNIAPPLRHNLHD